MSGVLTTVLAAFAVLVPPSQSNVWWWRSTVIVLALAAIVALYRGMMSQPIPRPHPLRLQVERFICDLSEAKDGDNFGKRVEELRWAFQKEGIYPVQRSEERRVGKEFRSLVFAY